MGNHSEEQISNGLAQSVPLWDIDEGIQDVPRFLRLLPGLFPGATMFCAEGTRILPGVKAIYRRHAAAEQNAAPRQTLWPAAARYACRPSPEFSRNWRKRPRDASRKTYFDHLFLFEGDRRLIEWHDVFANALLLDGSLPEATVAALAAPFGLRYHR